MSRRPHTYHMSDVPADKHSRLSWLSSVLVEAGLLRWRYFWSHFWRCFLVEPRAVLPSHLPAHLHSHLATQTENGPPRLLRKPSMLYFNRPTKQNLERQGRRLVRALCDFTGRSTIFFSCQGKRHLVYKVVAAELITISSGISGGPAGLPSAGCRSGRGATRLTGR